MCACSRGLFFGIAASIDKLKPSDSASASNDESESPTSSDEADADEHVVDPDEPKVEAPASPAHSHHEADDVVDPFGDDVGAAAAPGPLPDPVLHLEPLYDLGIQKVEIASSGKAVCAICGVKLAFKKPRLVYHPAKSVVRYLHVECCDKIPVGLIPHSNATLTYQRDVVAGPYVLELRDALATALVRLL